MLILEVALGGALALGLVFRFWNTILTLLFLLALCLIAIAIGFIFFYPKEAFKWFILAYFSWIILKYVWVGFVWILDRLPNDAMSSSPKTDDETV